MRRARPADLLTVGEAAALLGVSGKTVGRMVDAGELPSTRTLGGHRRVPRAAVRAILDGEDAKLTVGIAYAFPFADDSARDRATRAVRDHFETLPAA